MTDENNELIKIIKEQTERAEDAEKEIEQLRKEKDVITKVYNRQCSVVIELNVQVKSLKIVSQGLEKEIEELEKENAGLKKNLERYSQEIAEQEETIDAQDNKINFYVSKMNENILKRQELEKENAELKVKLNGALDICNVPEFQIQDRQEKINELEKENKALGERVLQLQADKGKLIDENRKMRCCENCEHNGSDSEIGENGDYTDYTCIQCDDFSTKENPYPNWELAE